MVLLMELADANFDCSDTARSTSHRPLANMAGWFPLVAFPALVSLFRMRLAPWQFMWALSIAIFVGCKWETWTRARSERIGAGLGRNLGYLLLWPGMDARAFLRAEKTVTPPRIRDWLVASVKTVFGASLVWLAACKTAQGHADLAVGWVGMIGLVLTLHFGLFHLIALAWQAAGVAAQPIMNAPIRSTSLGEFWGKRWNLGFRQLTHGLVFQPVRRHLGPAVAALASFLASGLVHDFVISFPAGGGYGLPTAYFLIQGLGVLLERSKVGVHLGIGRGFRGSLFTLLCTAAPAFWLFHPIFVRNVMLPFFAWIGSL